MIKPNLLDYLQAVDISKTIKRFDQRAKKEREAGRPFRAMQARKMTSIYVAIMRGMAERALRGE